MSQSVPSAETQPLVATNSNGNQLAAVVTQNAFAAFFSRTRDSFGNLLKERKPWSEVFDRSSFAKPGTLSEATGRMRKNVGYFKVNYALFILATTAVCFLATPAALMCLVGLAVMWFVMLVLRPGPITIGGKTFGEREKFFGLLGISLVVAFFLSSIGAVLFYALALGAVCVAAHGAFRVPDDLFLDEPEAATGFLSFLNFPAGTALPAGPPTVVTAV